MPALLSIARHFSDRKTYAIVMVVRPLVTVSSAPWIRFSVWESREDVASSRSMIVGCLRIARAIAT